MRCSVTIEVALEIRVPQLPDRRPPSVIADRLCELGGQLVAWQPDLDGAPARAQFKFKNLARRDQFIADALAIPGVSLATFR